MLRPFRAADHARKLDLNHHLLLVLASSREIINGFFSNAQPALLIDFGFAAQGPELFVITAGGISSAMGMQGLN